MEIREITFNHFQKQPIIALYFESETVLAFYDLKARSAVYCHQPWLLIHVISTKNLMYWLMLISFNQDTVYVLYDPSQQFFSHVETGLPGFNQC